MDWYVCDKNIAQCVRRYFANFNGAQFYKHKQTKSSWFSDSRCRCFCWKYVDQGLVSLTFFSRNSNSMEIWPCHNSVAGHQIATIFCTCHESTAVVPCAKFCSDHCIRIEVRVKRNFHRIWIAMEKPLVKRGPVRTKQTCLSTSILCQLVCIMFIVYPCYSFVSWFRSEYDVMNVMLKLVKHITEMALQFVVQWI